MSARKKCAGCGLHKLHANFHRQASHSDGLASRCKVCSKRQRDDRRAADGQVIEDAIAYSTAYRRALNALRRRHPQEFKGLLLKERGLS